MTPDDRDQRMERLRKALDRDCRASTAQRESAYRPTYSGLKDAARRVGWTGTAPVIVWAYDALAAHDQAKAAERSGG